MPSAGVLGEVRIRIDQMTTPVVAYPDREPRHIPLVRQPRPSSLPLFMACPMSHKLNSPQIRITEDDAAHLGRAVHELINHYLSGRRGDFNECLGMATRASQWCGQQVDDDDCRYLFQQFGVMWQDARHAYQFRPEPGTLLSLPYEGHAGAPGYFLEGTPDVFAVSNDTITVGDFKSGWGLDDYYHQIMAYLYLLAQKYPGRDWFVGYVYHLRHEKTVKYVKTYAALRQWFEEFQENILNGNTYRIGPHCQNCTQVLNCSAINRATRSLCGPQLHQADRIHTYDLSHSNLQQSMNVAKAARNMIRAVDHARDAIVEASGGMVIFRDGRSIRRVPQWRKAFDPVRAMPVLSSVFGMEEAAKFFKVTHKGLLEAAKRKFPHEPARQIVRAVMERLLAADAVTEYPVNVCRQDHEPEPLDSGDEDAS